MKKCLLLFFLAAGITTSAQSTINKMLEQIGLLQVYISYIQKGYRVAKNGLHLIGSITDGSLQLDTRFFESLRVVNPAVRASPATEIIVIYADRLEQLVQSLLAVVKGTTVDVYTQSIVTGLLRESRGIQRDLEALITDRTLQLDDGERLQALDRLARAMQDAYSFLRDFATDVYSLLRNQQNDQTTLGILKKLYGQ